MSSSTQRGVASVEVAGAILKALRGANRDVGLQELADLTGIASSRLHHYMVSLLRTGLVFKDPASHRYVLGTFALELGLVAADNLSTQHASASWLRQLSTATKESTFFAAPSPHGALIVRWEQGSRPLTVHARLGTVMPILSSATGLVALAFKAPHSADVFEAELRRIDPARREAVRRKRAKEAEQARRDGVASARGTVISNVYALSCPVITRSAQVAGMVTVLGLGNYFDADPEGKACKLLRRCAHEFGERLA